MTIKDFSPALWRLAMAPLCRTEGFSLYRGMRRRPLHGQKKKKSKSKKKNKKKKKSKKNKKNKKNKSKNKKMNKKKKSKNEKKKNMNKTKKKKKNNNNNNNRSGGVDVGFQQLSSRETERRRAALRKDRRWLGGQRPLLVDSTHQPPSRAALLPLKQNFQGVDLTREKRQMQMTSP
ncbi:hypothetical protein EYF80_064095 [Liparis tanakae]|uniref:Uncharacterized protein n=1 Tax=Liparis tanakae TaxID=230148 RepID=A0A4Z2EB56_9TELE|nr:hypothetical protein EYF80_064095 [Liparis tanakae]